VAADLTSLSRVAEKPRAVPRPGARWKTRVLLPTVILLAVLGLLAYAARDALTPAVSVRVAAVVVKEGASASAPSAEGKQGANRADTVIVQAPGWIEPDPYAINVAALAEGVVKEVLVLEGQRVEAGQVVVRLVDDDAKLALQRAEAEVAEREAEVARSRADVAAAEADAAEVRDEVDRKRALVAAGGFSEGQFARLELRLQAGQRRVEAAKAMVMQSEAGKKRAAVMRDEAALALSRMEVRSPVAGVVMTRLVEPGARLSMLAPAFGGAPQGSAGAVEVMGGVIRVYDPEKLQVRVDVPLADAGKIGVGTRAQIVCEALPGKTLEGSVTRMVHEANIQRNTVQFKVAIEQPDPVLRPEMLTRVRFLGAGSAAGGGARSPADSASGSSGLRLLAPAAALLHAQGGVGRVWVVDQSGGTRGPLAAMREVAFIPATESGFVEVTSGLRPGDRVLIEPPAGLVEGARLKIEGEATGGSR
jgi:HlyD family secretion protein